MFCFQCQEAAKGRGCEIKGVCGKTSPLSDAMDVLIYALKGIALYAQEIRKQGGNPGREADDAIIEGLFMTITNANFNEEVITQAIHNSIAIREELQQRWGGVIQHPCVTFQVNAKEDIKKIADDAGFLAVNNEDIRSLQSLVIFGLKGLAAYYHHALNLGKASDELDCFIEEALAYTTEEHSGEELTEFVLKTGEYGVKVMAILDEANTSAYGHPQISKVALGVRNNPGILISGHDLKDMEELLKQTEGTGIDVYTHSEMLPAHYYPQLNKYPHLAGNYGSSWWHQNEDFENFNGPILMTTNCIVPPKSSNTYLNRMYTTGAAGYPGAKHIGDKKEGGSKDFSSLIEQAKVCSSPKSIETGEIVGGFAHNQVLSLADKIVEAVKTGAIKKFVVMAGCDGRFKERSYYTDFAQDLSMDTVILTAGCAKYRYNKLDLGDIGGIPRVLDAGQCNDCYSLAVIALKLKEAFGLEDINDLPIVYNIAWYEQKAVIVLLALLHLGVKNIHLGPTLPAFLSPAVTKVLVDHFNISGISTVKQDLEKLI